MAGTPEPFCAGASPASSNFDTETAFVANSQSTFLVENSGFQNDGNSTLESNAANDGNVVNFGIPLEAMAASSAPSTASASTAACRLDIAAPSEEGFQMVATLSERPASVDDGNAEPNSHAEGAASVVNLALPLQVLPYAPRPRRGPWEALVWMFKHTNFNIRDRHGQPQWQHLWLRRVLNRAGPVVQQCMYGPEGQYHGAWRLFPEDGRLILCLRTKNHVK